METALLLLVVPLTSGVLWLVYWKNSPFAKRYSPVFLAVILLIASIFRVLNLNNAEGNEDTSTWLASVLSMEHYPNTWWTLLNFSDSRPLTVLPLFIAAKLGVVPTYASAQLLGVSLWLGTIGVFYAMLRLWTSAALALLWSWFLCLFIGTTGYFDYISYNSEHVSVLMISLASYGYLRYEFRQKLSGFWAFLLGMLLGSLLYAKFQNIPMGLVIATYLAYLLAYRRAYGSLIAFVAGGIVPTLGVHLYYAWHDSVATFWNGYFWNYYYYSYSTEFSSQSMTARFDPVRIGYFIFRSRFHGLYFIPLLAACLAGILFLWPSFRLLSKTQKRLGSFAVLLLGTSVYASVQSGNFFDHYLLYLLVPFTFLAAWLCTVQPPGNRQRLILAMAFAGAVVQGSFNLYTRQPLETPVSHRLDKKLVAMIRANGQPNDRLVVWGWADRLYVQTRRAAGYRNSHTHHLFMKTSSLYPFREKLFLEDIQRNRPALFVDASVKGISIMENMLLPHDRFPAIAACIRQLYEPIGSVDGVRFYRRRTAVLASH
ncbi:hypothetical protein [Arundinibacter roseus]|uniref:Glycosyltransferase RgtA/B/C/D-like domain-containing protein n=1 Tax=Arundinibacter roseus TaxID=2070510 RepID=A0A4R4KQP1_9BACT|nr:hypothetical protein [Arundinibacter roseus]TDB68939.1 hypothetical protein EZE20_00965 [Arundinibacter roseus]